MPVETRDKSLDRRSARNAKPGTRNPEHIETVRRFNRFYTKRIGVLQEGLLESDFSLTEVRVLYELAHLSEPNATQIADELGLDPGYLSRILNGFEKKRFIEREPSRLDARQSILRLTKRGRGAFATLDSRSQDQIRGLLKDLSEVQQDQLVRAMGAIEEALEAPSERERSFILRTHQPVAIAAQ